MSNEIVVENIPRHLAAEMVDTGQLITSLRAAFDSLLWRMVRGEIELMHVHELQKHNRDLTRSLSSLQHALQQAHVAAAEEKEALKHGPKLTEQKA